MVSIEELLIKRGQYLILLRKHIPPFLLFSVPNSQSININSRSFWLILFNFTKPSNNISQLVHDWPADLSVEWLEIWALIIQLTFLPCAALLPEIHSPLTEQNFPSFLLIFHCCFYIFIKFRFMTRTNKPYLSMGLKAFTMLPQNVYFAT